MPNLMTEDQLKKKMQLAKASGWSDEDIQSAVSDAQSKGLIKTGGGGISDWLPAVGGVAGGLLGSAVAPGVGTAIGATAGSAAFEALRERMTGEDLSAKKIATQGAWGLAGEVGGAALGKIGGKLLGKAGSKIAGTADETAEGILKSTGKSLKKSVVKPKVQASPWAATKEDEIVKVLDDLGFKGGAKAQYEMMPKKYNELTAKISEILKKEAKPVDRESLKKMIQNNFEKDINIGLDSPAKVKATDNIINEIFGTKTGETGKFRKLSTEDAFNYKKELNGRLSGAFDKKARGVDPSPNEHIYMNVRNALDEYLTKAHPDIKNLTKTQSILHEASAGLQSSSKEEINIMSTKIPVLSEAGADLMKTATDLTGRKINSLADLSQNELVKLIAGQAAKQGGIRTAGSYLFGGNGAEQDQGYLPETPESALSDYGEQFGGLGATSPETAMDGAMGKTGAGITKQDLAKIYLQDLQATGGKNFEEIETIANLLLPSEEETKKMSEGDKKFALAEQEASKALSLVEAGVPTGKIPAFTGKFKEYFGTQDPQTTALRSQIATARTAARNALLGANMSDKELESYLDSIFDYSDQPNIIRQKLATFIQSMQDYKQSVSGTTSEALPDDITQLYSMLGY